MSSLHRQLTQDPGALGAGLTFAASLALFAFGGLWLDDQFGTKPLWTVVLILCGLLGGTLHLIRVLAPQAWPFGKLPARSKPSSSNQNASRQPSQDPSTTAPPSGHEPAQGDGPRDVGS